MLRKNSFIYRILFLSILPAVLLWSLLFYAVANAGEITRFPFTNPDKLQYHPINFTPPQAQRAVLENGIILYIFEDHELPLLNISAVVRTGYNQDPPGKEGLAELTGMALRTGGTKTMSGNAVNEALDFFAGSLAVSMDRDSGSINLSVLKNSLDDGLNILSQIITSPVFEEAKVKTAKDLKIEELRRTADDPQKLAFRELKRFLYRNNPVGRLPSLASVNDIQREDLIRFYRNFFYPKNIMIAVSGDITKEEAVGKIRQYFGAWSEPVRHYDIPPIPVKQKGQLFFIFKEIPQSIIISAQLAPGRNNPDAYPFEVLDFILGSGGFKSRIFQQIRNNLGLAYSTGSFYAKRSEYGAFGAYAITRSEATAQVLSHIRTIISDVVKNGVDKNELAGAIKSINNNFIFSFNSAERIARQQLMLEYEKLPGDYLVTYRDNITKVQGKDLMSVAGTYLSQDDAVVLVVGNEIAYNQLLSTFGNVTRIEGSL